jgi:transposase-like protein
MATKNTYTNEFKLKAVLESYQRDTTIEKVIRKFSIHRSVINRWRTQFKQHATEIFDFVKKPSKNTQNELSTEELKKIIGDQAVQISILKKTLETWD